MKSLGIAGSSAFLWLSILATDEAAGEITALVQRSPRPVEAHKSSAKLAGHVVPRAPLVALGSMRPSCPTSSIPLHHLSSGALRLLDSGDNLVQSFPIPSAPYLTGSSSNPPTDVSEAGASAAALATDPAILAGLDPRVGFNLRLGEDPSQLPSTIRAQAEPHIARHPTNADFLAATFQEGRFQDSGASGLRLRHQP